MLVIFKYLPFVPDGSGGPGHTKAAVLNLGVGGLPSKELAGTTDFIQKSGR